MLVRRHLLYLVPWFAWLAAACETQSTDSSNIASWSDQELQRRLANLRMGPADFATWTCLERGDQPCTPLHRLKGAPDFERLNEIYVREQDGLKATVCIAKMRCMHAEIKRGEGEVSLVSESGLVLAKFWATQAEQLQGEMLAFGKYWTGSMDHPYEQTQWRGPAVISELTTTPTATVTVEDAFKPMVLEFSQRVACDSIRFDVRDEKGQVVFLNQAPDCSRQMNDAERGLRSHVASLSIDPPGLWAGTQHTVSIHQVYGLQQGAVPMSMQAPVFFKLAPVPSPVDEELRLSDFQYSPSLSCVEIEFQNLMASEKVLPARGDSFIVCRTQNLSSGGLQTVLDVPEGHRHLSFQVASYTPPADASQFQKERMHWKSSLHYFTISSQDRIEVLKSSEIRDPEVTPTQWSGWSTVRTRIPDGVHRIGVGFQVLCASDLANFPSANPDSRCENPATLLIDDVHTEP